MNRFAARLPLAALTLLGASPALAGEAEGVKEEVLLRESSSWDGTPYAAYPAARPQLTTIRMTIPPRTVLPWHTHPMPNAVVLLSGTLTLEDRETGKTQVFHAGDALAESAGRVHRGLTGDEAAVLIITYAGSAGQDVSRPAQP